MMNIKVEVISRETIKPYTPTPGHLRHYQFSFLDQPYSPSGSLPLIYFYNTLDHGKDIASKLKESLSKVLTHYYPLAGCFKDNFVDCNDQGVLFLEAQVDCQLSQIAHESFAREFSSFFPYDDLKKEGFKNSVLAIQINFFKCGTLAIGALLSHRIADASSMITFIRNWAAATAIVARGGSANFFPQLVPEALFPPKDVRFTTTFDLPPPDKNIVLKRFVFSGSAIAALQEKYTGKTSLDNEMLHPTRIEVVSAFIWSRFIASTQAKKELERPSVLLLTENFRKRMEQPLPILDDRNFGNLVAPAVTFFSEIASQEDDQYRNGVLSKLRDAKNKVIGLLDFLKDEKSNQEKMGNFYFSSFCRFPVHEADFGWGWPVWVALGGAPYSNLAILVDSTKCGDGIEAWIHLREEDMAKFESDKELLSFLNFTNIMRGRYLRLMAKY